MKAWLWVGAVNGWVAVAAGAFAAHALKQRLSPELLAIFETGARYHLYHALSMVAVGLFALHRPSRLTLWAGALMQAGIGLFCGSLYAMALYGVRALGAVTPLGGLAFLAGWALLALAAFRAR